MSPATAQAKSVDQGTLLAEERTSLAVERSRIAEERTMMAWIRTSLSMISFGFAFHKFFQFLRESDAVQSEAATKGPRNFGMGLIALGVLVLIIASFQHRQSMKRLDEISEKKLPLSLALVTAILLALGGIIAFFSILYRFGPF